MPERDIESLGVMGWGVGWGWKFCRRRRRRRRPPEWVFWGETVSSRLGLRTEISARHRLQMNPTDSPHLCCFHENVGFGQKSTPFSVENSYQFSVETSNPLSLVMGNQIMLVMTQEHRFFKNYPYYLPEHAGYDSGA